MNVQLILVLASLVGMWTAGTWPWCDQFSLYHWDNEETAPEALWLVRQSGIESSHENSFWGTLENSLEDNDTLHCFLHSKAIVNSSSAQNMEIVCCHCTNIVVILTWKRSKRWSNVAEVNYTPCSLLEIFGCRRVPNCKLYSWVCI